MFRKVCVYKHVAFTALFFCLVLKTVGSQFAIKTLQSLNNSGATVQSSRLCRVLLTMNKSNFFFIHLGKIPPPSLCSAQQVNSDLTLFEGSSCSKLHGKPLLSGFRSRRGAGNKVCFNFILKREAETQRIRQTRGGQHLTTFHSFSTRCGKLLCLTMRGLAAAAVQGRKSPCGN